MIFLAIGLANFWLVYMFRFLPGPLNLFEKIRTMKTHPQVAKLLNCPYCLSVWTVAPMSYISSQFNGATAFDAVVSLGVTYLLLLVANTLNSIVRYQHWHIGDES